MASLSLHMTVVQLGAVICTTFTACHPAPPFQGLQPTDAPNPIHVLVVPRDFGSDHSTATTRPPTALAGGFSPEALRQIDDALVPARSLGFEIDVRAYSTQSADDLLADLDRITQAIVRSGMTCTATEDRFVRLTPVLFYQDPLVKSKVVPRTLPAPGEQHKPSVTTDMGAPKDFESDGQGPVPITLIPSIRQAPAMLLENAKCERDRALARLLDSNVVSVGYAVELCFTPQRSGEVKAVLPLPTPARPTPHVQLTDCLGLGRFVCRPTEEKYFNGSSSLLVGKWKTIHDLGFDSDRWPAGLEWIVECAEVHESRYLLRYWFPDGRVEAAIAVPLLDGNGWKRDSDKGRGSKYSNLLTQLPAHLTRGSHPLVRVPLPLYSFGIAGVHRHLGYRQDPQERIAAISSASLGEPPIQCYLKAPTWQPWGEDVIFTDMPTAEQLRSGKVRALAIKADCPEQLLAQLIANMTAAPTQAGEGR